ncbi:MAG: quinone-dependent dihydroorotate dehydrogenase [Campylobacterales bacterium]|nr:quinone-dependent dihydroorotate dehydrogenase [Campylobacterales bacterium]
MNYEDIKKLLFKIDPETVHTTVEKLTGLATYCPFVSGFMTKQSLHEDDILVQELFGTTFRNPVGLAAGYDKDGKMAGFLPALGFGYIEVGTVTPLPQDGNPKPRLFRHPEDETLQNAMGFNNGGMVALEKRLEKITPNVIPIGINIGKNKLTTPENTIDDYKKLVSRLESYGDYLVVNISSPNTPGLRDLQSEEFIENLFKEIKPLTQKPIFLKIAPDLEIDTAVSLCKKAVESKADGIIATNTTNDYSLIDGVEHMGGLSGKVLTEKSGALFEEIAKELYKKTTLISVGGIDNGEEAYRRIKAGASLVQVYTALIYKGPALLKEINSTIAKNLEKDGFKNIKEAIGANR